MKWPFHPCTRYRRDLSLLAAGVLADPEKRPVARHLETCASCRTYYVQMQAVTGPLAGWAENTVPLQPTPAARHRWARAIQAADGPEVVRPSAPVPACREWCRDVIWPCRRIWAGLAAVWLVILAGNVSLRDHSPALAANSPPPSPEMIVALKDQQRILAELLADHSAPAAADRQKSPALKPRTQRAAVLTT